MRIESVTAHAFGPLTEANLELAPGLTVVAGVNESAKSSWHAALYAALCGRTRGGATPTPEDRRLVDRYKPWDGAPWLVSATVVLDDGRRLRISQNLDVTGSEDRGRVLEIGEDDTETDVTAEVLTAGAPDASRWLGLDRAAFAAVGLVNQAEHQAVRDAADGLQHYLRRAAETARSDGSATPALDRLDHFLTDRLAGNGAGPLPLAQERVRLAREGRVMARRGHEQYLADLAAAGGRRAASGDEVAQLRAAETTVQALEQVQDAARAAEEGRSAAERTRSALSAARAACAEAESRSARVAALQAQVPRQNTGYAPPPLPVAPPADTRPDDDGVLDTVAAARSAWDAAPVVAPLSGPSAQQLRADLAGLPDDSGVDPAIRELAEAHETALAAAERQALPRPSPHPMPDPGQLRRTADTLEAVPRARRPRPGPDAATLASAVEAARTQQRTTAEAAETAEREAVAAEERYQKLRATAAKAHARRNRRSGGPLRALLLTIVSVGVGLAALYFGLLAAVVLSAVVILPVVVSLLAVVFIAVRAMTRRATKKPDPNAAPVVEDLVGAVVTVREKRATAERTRAEADAAEQHATQTRARHVAALRGEEPDPAREQALAWCASQGLRAEPAALRGLAEQLEDQAARRDAERARFSAAVAHTGDGLRAALRERGILDQGSPMDQFHRYVAEAGLTVTDVRNRRVELERAIAARVTTEETAAQVASVRREAAAQLRSAAGAAGLDTSGDPESLVRALDGWRETRTRRAAVALVDWPELGNGHGNGHGNGNGNGNGGNGHGGNGGHGSGSDVDGELAALLAGGSLADLRRREEQLRAEREDRLTQAWKADLHACESRQRRDELAAEAGIDPVRAGDRAFVASALDVARAALTRARGAVTERGTTEVPTDAPAVARADEEAEAAEEQLRRVEQLRRTTSLARRYLSRAQEQTHRDVAPVLASTLRSWLPRVTRGRYVDALVDPETLAVKVYGPAGQWRPADRLSAGTTDQVYLLLRVALAQHLVATGETCPLLLDGVTAQADDQRTEEILDLLLQLGAERQVVLFTHEDSVLRWAREHLDGDRHRVRELRPLVVG